MGQPDTYDVVLLAFDTEQDTSPAEGLRRMFGLDENTAWRLVDNLPVPVQRGVPIVRAEYFRRALTKIGALVEVRDQHGEVVPEPAEPAPVASTALSDSPASPLAPAPHDSANDATAATLDGSIAATARFEAADVQAAQGRRDPARDPGMAWTDGTDGVRGTLAAPMEKAPLRSSAHATLPEGVPAPAAAAAIPAATAAPGRAEPTAFGVPAVVSSAQTASDGARAPSPAASADTAPGGPDASAPGPGTLAADPAQPRWAGAAELDLPARPGGAPMAPAAVPPMRSPMANMRSDVWDPPPPDAASTMPSVLPVDAPPLIERNQVADDADRHGPSPRAGVDMAADAADAQAAQALPALDLDEDALAERRRGPGPRAAGKAPGNKRARPGAPRPAQAKRAGPRAAATDATLDELPDPLANPPPPARKRAKRPPAGSSPHKREPAPPTRAAGSERPFWRKIFGK